MKKSHTFQFVSGKTQPAGGAFTGAWLVYIGLFLVAVLGIILVHEFGHYLAFRLRGYEMVTIRFNPFMGATSSPQEIQPEDMAWIVLGGTIFNLSVAGIAAQRASKTGGILRGLLRMYAAHAFLIEGTVVLAGFFVEETVTDFSWLMVLGVPPVLVACLGAGFVAVAGALLIRLWGDFGGHTRVRQALLSATVVLYLLVGAVMASAIGSITPSFIRQFMVIENILLTGFLAGLIVLIPLVRSRMEDRPVEQKQPYSLRTGIFWILTGMAAWVLSLL